MSLILLHTARSHRDTFDAIRDRIAPGTPLRHDVRQDWLMRAQNGAEKALAGEIAETVGRAEGPVICTCTTIGPLAEAAGAIRVDRPMMQVAARAGGPVLLAYCLDSTRGPSLDLLDRSLAVENRRETIHPLRLAQYWQLFEAGEADAFDAVIAGEVRQAARRLKTLGCVVLAQVSMAGAAPLLADLDVPVLTSPELAFRAALAAT